MRSRMLITATAVVATIVPVTTIATTESADAAKPRTWNRLAQCEASGRWHINTGNGYFGGLQISPSTWRAYGGRKFARLPHRATKREQIRVGEKIKRGQGWGAWPACSRKLGLR